MLSRVIAVFLSAFLSLTQFTSSPRLGGAPPADAPKLPDTSLDAMSKKQGYRAVPMLLTTNGMHLVNANLDGQPFLLMVDTGGGVQIALGKEAGEKMGIKSDTHRSDPSGTLVGPGITAYKFGLGSVQLVSLGDKEYRIPHPHSVHVFGGISGKETLETAEGVTKEVIVDGVLGQQFLRDHCALIDTERSVLYLQPLVVRELTKLRGQWECIWGERDGHPLAKGDEYRINVHDDRPTEFTLEGRSGTGYLFMNYAGPRKRIWSPSSDKTAPQTMIRGICEVTADRLKLCVFDESRKEVADSDWVDSHYPTKFEGKKDSCHIYYEFKRKTPGPPKK